MKPDYTITDDDIFLTVAKKYVTQLCSLDLLTCCRFDIRRPSLPTWVPNFSGESDRKFAQIMNTDASGRSACEATIVEDHILRLLGKRCCTIKTAVKLWDIGAGERSVVESVQDIAGRLGLGAEYLDGSSIKETLALILELGSVAENFEPMPVDHLERIAQAKALLDQTLALEPSEMSRLDHI